MIRSLLLLSAPLLIFSCDSRKTATNKFSDPDIQKIYDLKDRRSSDSLYSYLSHENPEIRREAALAFGSIQDSAAVANLAPLMEDKDRSVRKAVAFALGQTPCIESRRLLQSRFAVEEDAGVFNEIAEAYGKTAKKWENFSEQFYADSARDYGVAWSLYRAGLNNAVDTSQYRNAAKLLYTNHHEGTRLGAAHFFARGAKDFSTVADALIASAKADNSDDVQMAATFSLRKVKNDKTFAAITELVQRDNDFRVRVNAVRALQAFPFEDTKDLLLRAARDNNVSVAIAASEAVLAKVEEKYWVEIANVAASVNNWRVQANLYQAVLAVKDAKAIQDEIKTIYQVAKNPYQKAALLTALQGSSVSWSFIKSELQKADTPIVQVSALSALVSINRKKDFSPALKKEFLTIYKTAIDSGDPGLIATAADALADSTLGYRSIVSDVAFLKTAKEKLRLPKDADAVGPLEQAIAHFERRKNTYQNKNDWNHPIDWEFVKTIPKDQTAIIKTSKGNITIQFFVEEAPGSVSNFIELARKNYFDHKLFHRVVPNFVIQGGCYRGDGSGSEDYSIRSEFSERRYKTGSVGMASSGKDTEGTQWFITHSPTPHLDGRYTIFAEVTNGMEAVHQMEVGDEIIDVELPGLDGKEKKN